jgi:hypothetical protein
MGKPNFFIKFELISAVARWFGISWSLVWRLSHTEYIGMKKRTRGTETSQYLEERTSTETPLVVASERGPGQWPSTSQQNRMESRAVAGDSPVCVSELKVLE